MTSKRVIGVLLAFVACSGCGLLGGGGLDSEECKNYFAKVEECSKKAIAKGTPAGKVKAEAWRKSAEISRENFKKNSNPMAVKKSCEMMTPTITGDPDCQ